MRITIVRPILFFLVFCFSLSGCGREGSYVGRTNDVYQLTGATVGAVGGVALASMVQATAITSVVGGLAGAGLGYYLGGDIYQTNILHKAGGLVYKVGDFITIVIPTDSLFDVQTTCLLESSGPLLDAAASIINRSPKSNVLVSGNTDGIGSVFYQKKLSEAQAHSVARALLQRGVIDSGDDTEKRRLTYVGFGNAQPIAASIVAKGLIQNRRIQITVYPTKALLDIGRHQIGSHNIGKYSD